MSNNALEKQSFTSYPESDEVLRILIVDDEENVRGIIKEVLTEVGHEVTEASSAEEALDLFTKNLYPLVITDIRMGEMSGLDLTRKINNIREETLIIVITSYASTDSAVMALREGVFDYLKKPFDDLDQITEVVYKAIEKIRAIQHKKVIIDNLQDKNQKLSTIIDDNKAKSNYFASMSHELRTPLNIILGFSELLDEAMKPIGDQEISKDIRAIQQAGHHLLTLINEILDLSKIDAGQMQLHIDTFSLDDFIKEMIELTRPFVNQNKCNISVKLAGRLGDVETDMTKLRQILFNLLSNAAKFTNQGTIEIYAHREKIGDKHWINIAVKDSGIGMTPDQLNRIFDPFVQADSSTTPKYGGTGLGLAITKRYCEMLGGEIKALSNPGKGSMFTVRIPAIYSENIIYENHEQVADANPQQQLSKSTADLDQPIQNTQTILIINSDPTICSLAKKYLDKEGFTVRTTSNGEKGLLLAKEIKPAIITLDIMLPDMDGWTVLKQIKNDPELKKIPVAMLTMLEQGELGFALASDEFLRCKIDS